MSTAKPQAGTRPAESPSSDRPWLWNVVLLDDQDHTYEYVIRMMQDIFGHSRERAFAIARKVDNNGRAICLTTHREHAELKVEQVSGFGRDPLMPSSKGSMSAVLEPAGQSEGEGGDEPADREHGRAR